MVNRPDVRYPVISKRVVAIVGGFGSGKTEISVNLAKYFVFTGHSRVTIIDLDLVNPYFRSREAKAEMEALGIRAVVPEGGNFYADLPILLPEIKGAIEKSEGKVILDVGGDAQGTRALGSLSEAFNRQDYEMLMVLNSRRPQTADVGRSIQTIERIEQSARLRFTGLVSNSHMIEETDPDVLNEGYELSREVSRKRGLPLVFISVKSDVLSRIDTAIFDCPILPLTRSMLKPWEQNKSTES
ncbi:MAG: cobalamin biosynthesis protein CbiA [Candidatus Zixiibacteriota bacterium]|nr:MAG: cobalamin biosynthesis protein CbiA [candidate division Zixibacteria bacterium]